MESSDATRVLLENEIRELKEKVFLLGEENAVLKKSFAEAEYEKKKSLSEIVKRQSEADKKLKSAYYVYLTAIREAKCFSDGFFEAASNGENQEKAALIDLLRDLLKDLKSSSAKEKVENGLTLLRGDEKTKSDEEQTFEFDLEEAINPKGELSLEELCKELGVYNG